MKRSDIDKAILKKKEKMHLQARSKFGVPKCKDGQIVREGFKRGSKWVEPTCIKAKGLARETGKKGKPLFVLKQGELSRFGYHNVANLPKEKRRNSLKKASKKLGALQTFRKLNALSLLQRNTNPKISKVFKDDANWLKTTKEYASRPTAPN